MEQRIYSGSVEPNVLAQHLIDTWDQGETAAQALESDEGIIVQVGQRTGGLFSDQPMCVLTLALEPTGDGLRVTAGEQEWYRDGGQLMVGGLIGFFPFFFTWPLGGGRGEPVEPQLAAQIWETIEEYARQYGAAPADSRPLPQLRKDGILIVRVLARSCRSDPPGFRGAAGDARRRTVVPGRP